MADFSLLEVNAAQQTVRNWVKCYFTGPVFYFGICRKHQSEEKYLGHLQERRQNALGRRSWHVQLGGGREADPGLSGQIRSPH